MVADDGHEDEGMIAALLRWLREETRLLGLHSWADGAYHGPPDPRPCTESDPRCVALAEKQARARAELRRLKRGLADGREVPDDFLAHTDVRATIRAANPPVRLLRKGAK